MFEEVCLVCGKHLQDDGQAYCSDDCLSHDTASPSISSSSSALSSPHLGYAAGGDVPALIPSALGSALKAYRGRAHYSSSSASSASVLTDDDDDDLVPSEYSFNDGADSLYEGSSKSAGDIYSTKPSALSYARRPSGTNNGSTYLHPDSRHSSSSGHVRGYPRSAPNHSHSSTEDDETFYGFSSRGAYDADEQDLLSEKNWSAPMPKSSSISKSKRSRNRASLPGYFSLLQMSSPSKETRSSPVSSSSGHTVARLSPPTPKLAYSTGLPTSAASLNSQAVPPVHSTPRGRRRVAGDSRNSRRSGLSSSSSRSRSRHAVVPGHSPKLNERLRARLDSRGSVEQVFDWSSVPGLPTRGRTSARRNSSPPPKMLLMGLEERARVLAAVRQAEVLERSDSRSRMTRGRARVDELDGMGTSKQAPGYGAGRSGLMNRERERTVRVPL